jgi:hypothetical protein
MAIGVKTGGRRAGTPNRCTAEVKQTLDALGCDPLEGAARIAVSESQPMALRAMMYRELAQYVAPKRKALEHTRRDGWLHANGVRDRYWRVAAGWRELVVTPFSEAQAKHIVANFKYLD